MITNSSKDHIYIGRGAGKELKEELNKAKKSIKIVSPYLTPSYIEELIALSNKGIKITLITSNEIKQGNGNHSSFTHTDLIKQEIYTNEEEKDLRKKGMKYSLFTLIFTLIFFFLRSLFLFWVSFIITGIIFYHFYNKKIYTYSYYSPINLKVVPDEYHDKENGKYFIHSKIYVIDEKIAYLGSVNYTYKAFKSNYETRIKVSSQKAVLDISKEVDKLFNNKEIGSIDINEWGKELYSEPRH